MDVMQTVLPCQLSHYFLADLFPHLPLFSLSLSLLSAYSPFSGICPSHGYYSISSHEFFSSISLLGQNCSL